MRIHKDASKKEKKKLTQEWKNFQGKRKDQYENSAKALGYSIIAMIILIIITTLFGSCATTKQHDKCCDKKETQHIK
jgi:hypothetical protein